MADRRSGTVDARTALEQFQDYLAPKLDVYEQAVYLYILRHSRLMGKPRMTIELKSAPGQIARGLGKRGSRLAPKTCLDKLRSLDAKGCIKLAGAKRDAPDVRVFLPAEIPGLVDTEAAGPDLEGLDFFHDDANRALIFKREGGRCFYCKRKIGGTAASIDHVDSRPACNDGYRNVVAACRRCVNRKGESSAEDLLRVLFREGFVTSDVLADRLSALQDLRAGRLRP